MHNTFLKSLIISFGLHTFIISLFFFHGNNFKKSETSMTEIIILSSNENKSFENKKDFNKEIDKQTLEAKNEISHKDKTNYFDKNEFDKTLVKKQSQPYTAKINTNDIYLSPNQILNKTTKIKKNISSEIKNFSGNKNSVDFSHFSASYKIGSEKNPHPSYPLLARKRGWEGRVIVQADIDKKGNVAKIKIKESSGFEVLDNESIKTLKKWKFTPAKQGDKFIEDVVEIPIKYLLTN